MRSYTVWEDSSRPWPTTISGKNPLSAAKQFAAKIRNADFVSVVVVNTRKVKKVFYLERVNGDTFRPIKFMNYM